MLLLSRIVPALFAASSLVQAVSVPRNDIFSGFVSALKEHNLTVLADNYECVAKTEEGKAVVDMIENGGKLTILAPENCAFEPDYPKLDAETLLYNAIWGSIDEGFKSDKQLTRRAASQSRSNAPSGAGMSGGGAKKRQGASYQVQNVNQAFTAGSRKRTPSSITIDQAVGSAKVVDRFEYKDIIILVIKQKLSLPGKASDLLSQPLIKGAPHGFTKFSKGLEKTGLKDNINEGKLLTAFVPIDESLYFIDELSKDELKCLLENHFLFGERVFSTRFEEIGESNAVSGKKLEFSVENGVHYVCCGESKATVMRTDVTAGNGVLHVIDRPLKCD